MWQPNRPLTSVIILEEIIEEIITDRIIGPIIITSVNAMRNDLLLLYK